MTEDLHTRLVAALQARLEVARAATPGPWYRVGPPWNDGTPWINAGSQDPHQKRFVCDLDDMADWDDDMDAPGRSVVADADHIAANDPATEIRRVEALLRVVERHRPVPTSDDGTVSCDWCFEAGVDFREWYPCRDIRDLAAGEGIEP